MAHTRKIAINEFVKKSKISLARNKCRSIKTKVRLYFEFSSTGYVHSSDHTFLFHLRTHLIISFDFIKDIKR